HLLELVVLIDARSVQRPSRRDERRHADAGARFEAHVAHPGTSRTAAAYGEAGAREQLRIVGDLAAENVPRKELVRPRAIAAHVAERRLRIGDGVRAIDISFARAARPAER